MKSNQIRDTFIQFFVDRGHLHQASVPIVNKEDPSLLFVNAGMNPFKDIILGNQPATAPRVATVQPCLRVSGKHNDLEEVGVDTYHHTLFEMLGNWSFGDYFKQEAIQWAWALLTAVYNLPKDRLYATTFAGDPQAGLQPDEEAAAFWRNYLPTEHVLPFSKQDNFWEMGEQGPCGPCSEIHIDLRSEAERAAVPAAQLVNADHPQVIEIWNLVFMQYNRQASGALVELPQKHVDTGMGFERLTRVLQGKTSNYDTDLFMPLIERLIDLSGKPYHQSETVAIAMRVVVDHVRAVAFAIADGQAPSNVKAGYVIRRILRRAVRYGYSYLDLHEPFVYQLVAVLVAQLGNVYPTLRLQQQTIEQVIAAEEAAFLKTLATGLKRLHQLHAATLPTGVIDGQLAFELYDTHGFPLDLTRLIAKEKGLTIDEAGFQAALKQQQLRSQKATALVLGDWQLLQPGEQALFVGYDRCSMTTSILQWRTVSNKQGPYYQLVLKETPFYPEGGGQVADVGWLVTAEASIPVLNVQKEHGIILHTVQQLPADCTRAIEARIDATQRRLAECNHTATHLLHAALQRVLGTHVVQKGSLVSPTGLRFDFTHPTKPTAAELQQVEALVNQRIRENIPCEEQRSVSLEAAKAMGAKALFGEKYGATVRVVAFDPAFSLELCGGTHVPATGHIGFFKIMGETAIGTGIRRIEAVTAAAAEAFVAQQTAAWTQLSTLLKQPNDLVEAVTQLISEKNQLQKQRLVHQAKAIQDVTDGLLAKIQQVHDLHLLVEAVCVPHAEALRKIAFHYQSHAEHMVVLLAAHWANKVQLTLVLSDGLLRRCTKTAPEWMQHFLPLVGGKGGGQAHFATAGGTHPAGIEEALSLAKKLFVAYYTQSE